MLRHNRAAAIGLVILILFVLVAIFADLIAPYPPSAANSIDRLQGPSTAHWFGTDQHGRDVLSRVVVGTRSSIIVGFGATVATLLLGTVIGLLSGYFRVLDWVLMRIIDGLMAIPAILLAIALMAISRPSLFNVIVAIAIADSPRTARLVRSIVMSTRGALHVDAARLAGIGHVKIMLKHLLPGTFGALAVKGTYVFASAIIVEAVLSFLGLGLPPTVPSWGNIIAEGRLYFQIYPHMVLFPAVILSVLVLSINMVGDALRDLLDPRMKWE
ncbi:ABC transporter permease [Aquicoccus porphyridii]|nr:ABC transporter permease [Aquicoccus porphyridii]